MVVEKGIFENLSWSLKILELKDERQILTSLASPLGARAPRALKHSDSAFWKLLKAASCILQEFSKTVAVLQLFFSRSKTLARI